MLKAFFGSGSSTLKLTPFFTSIDAKLVEKEINGAWQKNIFEAIGDVSQIPAIRTRGRRKTIMEDIVNGMDNGNILAARDFMHVMLHSPDFRKVSPDGKRTFDLLAPFGRRDATILFDMFDLADKFRNPSRYRDFAMEVAADGMRGVHDRRYEAVYGYRALADCGEREGVHMVFDAADDGLACLIIDRWLRIGLKNVDCEYAFSYRLDGVDEQERYNRMIAFELPRQFKVMCDKRVGFRVAAMSAFQCVLAHSPESIGGSIVRRGVWMNNGEAMYEAARDYEAAGDMTKAIKFYVRAMKRWNQAAGDRLLVAVGSQARDPLVQMSMKGSDTMRRSALMDQMLVMDDIAASLET